MAWLVKSEINGAPLTQEEYEKETLMLPRGMERYASLYETLCYIQDIDVIVILVCKVRSIEIPELFCITHEEAIVISDGQDQPSLVDIQSIRDSFIKSTHELHYFLQIIIGNKQNDLRMWVGLHNNKTSKVLSEIK